MRDLCSAKGVIPDWSGASINLNGVSFHTTLNGRLHPGTSFVDKREPPFIGNFLPYYGQIWTCNEGEIVIAVTRTLKGSSLSNGRSYIGQDVDWPEQREKFVTYFPNMKTNAGMESFESPVLIASIPKKRAVGKGADRLFAAYVKVQEDVLAGYVERKEPLTAEEQEQAAIAMLEGLRNRAKFQLIPLAQVTLREAEYSLTGSRSGGEIVKPKSWP